MARSRLANIRKLSSAGLSATTAKSRKLRGMDQVIANLQNEINRMKTASVGSVIEAAAFIRYDMDITPPVIPVDTGNLRSSWSVTTVKGATSTKVHMVFGALYALYVHERLDPDINWTRPNSGPKFFEYALKRNKTRILQIIAQTVKTR